MTFSESRCAAALALIATFPICPAFAAESIRVAEIAPTPITIEAESLVRGASATGGAISVQDMSSFGQQWSGNAQLFWRAPDPGRRGEAASTLTLTINVAVAGEYRVTLYSTQAPDFGDIQVSVNGSRISEVVGFSPGVRRTRTNIGEKLRLTAGPNRIEVRMFRKMSASKGSFIGLDSFELLPKSARDASRDLSGHTSRDAAGDRTGDSGRNVTSGGSQTNQQAFEGQVLGSGGKLTFATQGANLNTNQPGPTQQDSYAQGSSEKPPLHFDTALKDVEWHWQVARRPFTSVASLTPEGLLTQGTSNQKVFPVDLGAAAAIVEGKPPALNSGNQGPMTQLPATGGPQKKSNKFDNNKRPFRLYVRMVAVKGGKVFGPPSNTIIAHMKPGKSGVQQQADASFVAAGDVEKKKQEVNGYHIEIVNVKLPLFERSSRWGCVVIVSNPWANVPGHPLMGYKPNTERCPRKDPSKMEKSWDDWVGLAIEGWLFSYDKAVGLFNGIKSAIAQQVAEALPCEELGDSLKSGCEQFAETAANAAMTYAMAAAGVPPTLPTLSQLESAAEGEVVDSAVTFTCDQMKSQGTECTPEMEEAMRKLYQAGVDKIQGDLKKQGQEPQCGDKKTAQELGLLPMPCFSSYPNTKVKPASESIYEPPVVKIKVTRLKPAPNFHPLCMLTLHFDARNHWKGGNVPGIASPPIPAKDIQAEIYEPEVMPLPILNTGETVVLDLTFSKIRLYNLIGGTGGGTFTEWAELFRAGRGTVRAATDSRDKQILTFTGGQTPAPCSNADSESITLLKQ